ncbi:MAG: GNAT family N-acetyltransferase [Anaerolinea sp.]|nr:GNAT family N-acetyltransferase [Anaerolinea sp.]
MTFPALNTPRLYLREIVSADADDVFDLRSDEQTQRLNLEPMQYHSEAHYLIEWMHSSFQRRTTLQWGITLHGDDRVIGICGLHDIRQDLRRSEVGYDLHRDYWRQGIMTEAMRAVIAFAFEQIDLNRLYAQTRADNLASIRLLEKLHFHREGTLRAHLRDRVSGCFIDQVIFGLLADDPRSE